jgi:hypothetical protein
METLQNLGCASEVGMPIIWPNQNQWLVVWLLTVSTFQGQYAKAVKVALPPFVGMTNYLASQVALVNRSGLWNDKLSSKPSGAR